MTSPVMSFKNNERDLDVVLIAEFCDGRINSTGFYWQQIAQSLSENFRVSIVSPHVHPDLLDIGCAAQKVPKTRKFLSLVIPAKLYIFFRMSLSVFRAPIRNSTVLIGTNPIFMPLAVPIIKLLGPKKIVLLGYDLFPFNMISQARSIFLRAALHLISRLFLRLYSQCDEVIVCGRDMRELLINNAQSLAEKVSYVPNWGDSREVFEKIDSKDLKSDIRILFFGNLGRFQAIPTILDHISKVKSKDIQFIFAGSGDNAHLVERYAKQDQRIIYLGKIAMDRRKEIFRSSHVSIVSVAKGMKGTCVPSKSYFSLANYHPLLCFLEEDSEIDLLCREFACGWTIDLGDENALSDWVDDLSVSELQSKQYSVSKIPIDLIDGSFSINRIRSILAEQ